MPSDEEACEVGCISLGACGLPICRKVHLAHDYDDTDDGQEPCCSEGLEGRLLPVFEVQRDGDEWCHASIEGVNEECGASHILIQEGLPLCVGGSTYFKQGETDIDRIDIEELRHQSKKYASDHDSGFHQWMSFQSITTALKEGRVINAFSFAMRLNESSDQPALKQISIR